MPQITIDHKIASNHFFIIFKLSYFHPKDGNSIVLFPLKKRKPGFPGFSSWCCYSTVP